MTEPESAVRQRKMGAAGVDSDSGSSNENITIKVKTKKKTAAEKEDEYSPWIDILRVASFLIVAYFALSYLISNGDSWTWGVKDRPRFTRLDWWKSYFEGPLQLTLDELAAFDGTDPEKPIYLAINGTIYDVSVGARMYGPDGSYHAFAGCDASRGFVTGCFAEDRTPDMRGVVDMFLPVEDGEAEKYWSPAELEELRREERLAAEQRMHEALSHWANFFSRSDKYIRVGRVEHEEGWPEKLPRRELCASAQKKRPKRKIPEERKKVVDG